MTTFTMIGAGNVATHFATALHNAGYAPRQVLARSPESAGRLAEAIGAQPVCDMSEVDNGADIYVVAVSDAAIADLVPPLCHGREDKLFFHTAGSVSAGVFCSYAKHYGVVYPLQTLSRERDIDMRRVPLLVEGSDAQTEQQLCRVASEMGSSQVACVDSLRRRQLHLAAVFTSNFTNHCYHIAHQLLESNGLKFGFMLPLIEETTAKLRLFTPREAQTGPAQRRDTGTIQAHLRLLEAHPAWRAVYQAMTNSIIESVETPHTDRPS